MVSDVIVQIGPKAIPTLIEITHNGYVNSYINDLAREIIKKIGDEYQINLVVSQIQNII